MMTLEELNKIEKEIIVEDPQVATEDVKLSKIAIESHFGEILQFFKINNLPECAFALGVRVGQMYEIDKRYRKLREGDWGELGDSI